MVTHERLNDPVEVFEIDPELRVAILTSLLEAEQSDKRVVLPDLMTQHGSDFSPQGNQKVIQVVRKFIDDGTVIFEGGSLKISPNHETTLAEADADATGSQ